MVNIYVKQLILTPHAHFSLLLLLLFENSKRMHFKLFVFCAYKCVLARARRRHTCFDITVGNGKRGSCACACAYARGSSCNNLQHHVDDDRLSSSSSPQSHILTIYSVKYDDASKFMAFLWINFYQLNTTCLNHIALNTITIII